MQRDDQKGTNCVVSYDSTKLLQRERKQPATVLELNAVIFALTKFHQWVYARKIHVFTDYRPIQWLNSLAKHSQKLARWAQMLQAYNNEATYFAGKRQPADALTRLND